MADPAGQASRTRLGLLFVTGGTLILIALAAFVTIAVGFRHSFTLNNPPLGDTVEAMVMLSPVLVLGLLLLGYGHRLMRKG